MIEVDSPNNSSANAETITEAPYQALEREFADAIEHGDKLDKLGWLQQHPWVGRTATIGTVVSGVQYGLLNEIGQNASSSSTLMTCATVGAVALSRKYARTRQYEKHKQDIDSIDSLTESFGGDTVEVYRQDLSYRPSKNILRKKIPAYSTHIAWQPSIESADSDLTLTQSIARLSEAVQQLPVSYIALPKSVLQKYGYDSKLPPNTPTKPRDDWLVWTKGLYVKDKHNAADNQELYILTRNQLAEFTDRLHQRQVPTLSAYLAILERTHQKHPALRQLRRLVSRANEENLLRALESSLTKSVESHLTDVVPEVATDGIHRFKVKSEFTGHISSSRKSLGDTITWKKDGLFTGKSEDLLKHHGLTLKTLLTLPTSYKGMKTHQVVKLCEIGALLAVKDKLHPERPSTLPPFLDVPFSVTKGQNQQGYPTRGFQRRMFDRVLLRRPPSDASNTTGINLDIHRPPQAMAGLAKLIGIFAASTVIAAGVESTYEKAGLKSPQVPEAIERITDRLSTLAMDSAINAVDAASEAFDENQTDESEDETIIYDGASNNRQDTSSSGEYSGDQQLDESEGSANDNVGMYHIKSYNGMDSSGYWAENSAHHISKKIFMWRTGDSLKDAGISFNGWEAWNNTTTKLAESADYLPHPDDLNQTLPLLKVTTSISPYRPEGAAEVDIKYWYKGIPVKDKTAVVAAAINGDIPVKVHKLIDGNTILLLPNNISEGSVLEYWLSTDENEGVQTVESIKFSTGQKLDAPIKTWNTYALEKKTNKTASDISETKRYIRSQFKYELDPDTVPRFYFNRFDFLRAALSQKVGNCDTAASIMAIMHPDKLNYVTGFNNSNTPYQLRKNAAYLSLHEAHAWTVDRAGTEHDATPVKGMDSQIAEYFEEPEHMELNGFPASTNSAYETELSESYGTADKKDDESRYIPETLLLTTLISGILGGAYLGRSRVRSAALRFKLERINGVTDLESRLAYNLVNQAIHQPGRLDEKRYRSAKVHSRNLAGYRSAQWRNLTATHDKAEVEKRVKTAIKSSDTSPQVRRSLVTARQLYKYHQAT